jgi:hypothetical protein
VHCCQCCIVQKCLIPSLVYKWPVPVTSEVFGGDVGVRQGCPLSPFLFGVFVEMLLERLHNQHPTEGPTFDYHNAVHVPLLLFADDVALLVTGLATFAALPFRLL